MSHQPRRSYSTIDPETGRITRVEPPEPNAPARIRSRLESDDEVRARLRPAHEKRRQPWESLETFGAVHGRALDEWLRRLGLPPRRYVDEVIG